MSDRKKSYKTSSEREWERSDGLRNSLNKREDFSRTHKTEYAGVYDDDGNTILEKHGVKDHVSFNYWEVMKCEGTIMTHNHPNDSCFSQADIDSAETMGLREVRATTSTGLTFCLRRPDANAAKRGPKSGFGERYDRETGSYFKNTVMKGMTEESARVAGQKPLSSEFTSKSEYVRQYNNWVDRYNAVADKWNKRFRTYCSQWLKDHAKQYGWSYREEQR